MARIISVLAATFLVPLALNIITNRTTKSSTLSLDNFCMRPPKETATTGIVLTLFISSLTLLAINNRQLTPIVKFLIISLLALGMLLMLLPVRGFWSITVAGDRIESSRLWLFRKSANISDIESYEKTKNGMLIYIKGKKKPAFAVENIFTNAKNIERRLTREGVPERHL